MPENDLLGWTFTVEEVSAGVYRGHGEDRDGPTVELTRTDPDEAMRLLHERAREVIRRGL